MNGSHVSTTSMAGTAGGLYTLIVSTSAGRRAWSRGIGYDTPDLLERREQQWKKRLAKPAHFDRDFMNRIVKRELNFIPRGEKGSLQNFLRFSYNALRRKHLTLRKTRDETLGVLIGKIKKVHPEFIPTYDENYFEIHSIARALEQVSR